jgi:hypothetical protein
VNKFGWSDDERLEFDLLIADALRETSVVARRDIFLDGLDDAEQAHRFWATDVNHDIRASGADRILKSEQAARHPRVPVAHDDRVLGRVPRVMGTRSRDEAGKVEHRQVLFDFMTWKQLRDKLPEFAQQVAAYEADAHAVIRLLALESRAPSSANPAQACEFLGTTVEQWLLEEGAA